MQKLKDPTDLSSLLLNPAADVGEKYKAIFELKALGTEEAQKILIHSFNSLDGSELLKHEVAYALGQMKFNKTIEEFLISVLADLNEKPVVRHESGEALSNSENPEMIKVLKGFSSSPSEEVSVTCQLGVRKLETYPLLQGRYATQYSRTKEPAAPFNDEEIRKETSSEVELPEKDLCGRVLKYICDENADIFNKYRAVYYLRDLKTPAAIDTLCALFEKNLREKTKILLRHEVCFIFGQLESERTLQTLENIITDPSENEIVRHEAISAYSSISKDKSLLYFLNPLPLV